MAGSKSNALRLVTPAAQLDKGVSDADPAVATAPRRNKENVADLAYDQLEALIVKCELRPGRFLAIHDLQVMTGLGRTPIHQAVNRLAVDTLIIIHPRHGLQIAPIDLARERVLLRLRRDMERFVIQLAAERSSPLHRNQILHLQRRLRERRDALAIDEFNSLDQTIDRLVIAAANEPFLEHALRPLHTIFRRIGWIYHSRLASAAGLPQTVDGHLAVLECLGKRDAEGAVAASDRLIDFVDSMFEALEREVDPTLLDCSLALP